MTNPKIDADEDEKNMDYEHKEFDRVEIALKVSRSKEFNKMLSWLH